MGLKFNPFIGNFDFTGSGASVAGSNTQIQFNDGGAFGADSNLVWDKNSDALGVQVTPLNPIHVASLSGTTINNVTVGSASQASAVAAPSVTGSAIAIEEFAAPTTPGASANPSGSGYNANGQTIDYQIYGVVFDGSNYYRSANFASVSYTDTLNDSSAFSVNLSWDSLSEATHYLIEKQISGGGYNDSTIVAANSYEDTGWGGTDSYSSWPTFYTTETAPTAFTSGTAQYVNQGSGGIFEVSNTILMEVDSVKNINGTDYVSGSPTSGSFSDTGTGQYDAEINWTDNGNATNAIVRISVNSGSTWYYQYVGSSSGPYTFTSLSNDSSAESRWGQTFGGSTTHTFAVRGKALSPSGNIYYSTVSNTYSVNITTAAYYIVKHTFSGAGASGAKVLYPSSSPSYGQDVSNTDYYDIGYTSWGSGTTVTPSSYGFSGTDQVREYKIYSFASGIYGTTPLTVSTANTGGSKYNTVTWTLPSGVTQVKITRGINGAAHSVSKTVSGTSVTDDATDTSWTGNTTVSPTSIVPGTVRIDRITTSLTDSVLFKPNLELINTHNTGDRSAVLSFGVANGSSGSSTYQTHIYHSSSTGYLTLATGRLRIANSLGASTFTTQLGDTYEFNMLNLSSAHFKIRSQNNNTLFETRADRDTVYVGYNSSTPSDNTASLDVGRRSGGDHNIYIETGSTSNSGDAIKVAASGVFIGAWGANGNMGLRRSTAPTNSTLALGAVSSQTQLLFDTHSSPATVNGGVDYDGTNFFGANAGARRRFVRMSGTSAGTNTSLAYYDSNGFLTSSSNLQFDGTTLTASNLTVSTSGALKLPVSAAPTVDSNGEIAVDTTVTDFSHGLVKYYSGEELTVVAMPSANLNSPTDGYVVGYDATNDEFKLVAPTAGGSGNAISVTVDFGSVSGGQSDIATASVSAAWVGASTKIVCCPFAVATSDHDPDDYALEQITAYATNITAGVGFDIVATSKNGTFGQYVIHAIGV
jgi:hypothetical protein